MNAWSELQSHYNQSPVSNIYEASREDLQQEVLRLRAALILAEEEFTSALTYEEHTHACANARRIISKAIPPLHVPPDLKWETRAPPELRSEAEKVIQTVRVSLHRELSHLDRVLERFISKEKP